MSKKQMTMIPITKDSFKNFLKSNGFSIRKLGTMPEIGVSEKTIRRYLDDGKIPYELLSRIQAAVIPDKMPNDTITCSHEALKSWIDACNGAINALCNLRDCLYEIERGAGYEN